MRRRRGHSSRSRSDVHAIRAIGRLRLARTLAQTTRRPGQAAVCWIFSPWLPRSPRESDIWTSALAIHDVNGTLLAALPNTAGRWSHVYAGVFAVDPLRARGELIRHIKAAGVGGVINFPSVSFFDGEASATFDRLSLGMNHEIDCLEACAREGLRVGGVVRSLQAAQRLLRIGADFLVVHNGPPASEGQNSVAEARAIGEAAPRKIRSFLMSELIETMA